MSLLDELLTAQISLNVLGTDSLLQASNRKTKLIRLKQEYVFK